MWLLRAGEALGCALVRSDGTHAPPLAATRQPEDPLRIVARTLPRVSTGRPATYTYAELAERIEQVLGERPSQSALRAAAATARRTDHTQTRPRLTVGMPAALPASSRTAPAAFSAAAVEQWLEQHPRRAWNAAVTELARALADGRDPQQAIRSAREAGLSWRHITAALSASDGRTRSVAGVHKAYRHLDQA